MSDSSVASLFASKSVIEHLLRGVLAVVLFVVSYKVGVSMPVASIAAALGGIVLLRGCPMCWTIGLFATLAQSRKPHGL